MRRFSLSDADVQRAISLFTEASRPTSRSRTRSRRSATRRLAGRPARLFVQIQLEAALQAGGITAPARAVFARHVQHARHLRHRICRPRGHAAHARRGGRRRVAAARPAADRLADAARCGVRPEAAMRCDAGLPAADEQNHPDKLVANGLPGSRWSRPRTSARRQSSRRTKFIRKHRGMSSPRPCYSGHSPLEQGHAVPWIAPDTLRRLRTPGRGGARRARSRRGYRSISTSWTTTTSPNLTIGHWCARRCARQASRRRSTCT